MKKNNFIKCNNCNNSTNTDILNSSNIVDTSSSSNLWPLPNNSIPSNGPIYTNYVCKLNMLINSSNNLIFSIYLDITPQIINNIFCQNTQSYVPLSTITFNQPSGIVTFTTLNIYPFNDPSITFIITGAVNLGNQFINNYTCNL